MHSLIIFDASGIFHVFIYEWLFTRMFVCCCCNLMFYEWSECVIVYLAPENIPHAIVMTLGNKVILYCNLYVIALACFVC